MADDKRGKVYLLDTSVLIHDPRALQQFADTRVAIPIYAIEELDGLKKHPGEKGVIARSVSKKLDALGINGYFNNGGVISEHNWVSIVYGGLNFDKLPIGLEKNNDNRMIIIAKELQDAGHKVILVSKDTNLRLKSRALGVPAEDYKSDKSIKNIEELYSGRVEIELSNPCVIPDLYSAKENWLLADVVLASANVKKEDLYPNQCCYLKSAEGKTALAIYKATQGIFRLVKKIKPTGDSHKIHPKNGEQLMAYGLLRDPNIKLVTIAGKAGCGKTLMALLAGVEEKSYECISVYRPNQEMGNKMGFLPGDVQEKMDPYKYPITDNFNLILGASHRSSNPKHDGLRNAEDYMRDGLLEISPTTYVRGRSLINRFIIVDEAQNLTPHEIKTLITRVGGNSKMVITGDPSQIDNPYVDAVSNGLSYTIERFKGQEMFGHITMIKSERSDLAELAANLL